MRFRPCLSLALMLCVVTPLVAQSEATKEAKYEASAGYSYLNQQFHPDRQGWVLSFAEKVGKRGLGVEAEVGGNYRKITLGGLGRQNDFTHSILAGPQFRLRENAKFIPWVHVLAGITLDNIANVIFFATGPGVSAPGAERLTRVRFGFQPGGGIDYRLTSGFAIRLGADYRRAINSGDQRYDTDFFRLQSGIVVRF
jgi:opacity protein-like surface antigen